jgi:hypothetical protein
LEDFARCGSDALVFELELSEYIFFCYNAREFGGMSWISKWLNHAGKFCPQKKKRKKKKRRRGIVMVDLVYAKRLLVDDKEFVCVSVYLEYII